MKSLICGLSALLLSATVLSAKEDPSADWTTKFADRPVGVINQSNNQRMSLKEVRVDKLVTGAAEIPMERVVKDYKFQYVPTPVYNRYRTLCSDRKYEEAVEAFRPEAYAMVKFMVLERRNIDIHDYVKDYVRTLILADYPSEAGRFLTLLPLDRLDDTFGEYSVAVARKLLKVKRPEEANKILSAYHYSSENPGQIRRVLEFASELRIAGQYEDAAWIYQKIAGLPGLKEATPASLWYAYCKITVGQVESADSVLRRMTLASVPAEYAGLYHLVLGNRALKLGKQEAAIDELAQSVVGNRLTDDWAPNALYLTAECYSAMGYEDTAKSVYRQVAIFYPKTIFGQQAAAKGGIEAPVLPDAPAESPEPGEGELAPVPDPTPEPTPEPAPES